MRSQRIEDKIPKAAETPIRTDKKNGDEWSCIKTKDRQIHEEIPQCASTRENASEGPQTTK
jgi:hypothetical protein